MFFTLSLEETARFHKDFIKNLQYLSYGVHIVSTLLANLTDNAIAYSSCM